MENWQWIITTGLGIGAAVLAVFWRFVAIIRRAESAAKRGDDELHARINRFREEAVHKSDLDGHLNRLIEDMRAMRNEHQTATSATNTRLDALMAAIVNGRREDR